MAAATERTRVALRDQETILVHGDYDVDGVTGTALLMRLLELIGARAVWHIPNRLIDGYSFGAHSVARALEVGAKVVISVDNGTSAGETIARLLEHGIDTIVTDHHEPPLGAAARCDRDRTEAAGSLYPMRELCGGAVACFPPGALPEPDGRAQGLRGACASSRRPRPTSRSPTCDVVPLVDENRVSRASG
jgi:single-stranded-DNA-specific exonuclease